VAIKVEGKGGERKARERRVKEGKGKGKRVFV